MLGGQCQAGVAEVVGADAAPAAGRVDGLARVHAQSSVRCPLVCRACALWVERMRFRWYAEDCERLPLMKTLKGLGDRLLPAVVSPVCARASSF